MAAVTHEDARAVTTNAETYASNSFTPAAGDLLVVFCVVGATAAGATMTNSLGLTMTPVDNAAFRGSADKIFLFVSATGAAASAQTVTLVTVGGDPGNGCIHFVAGVAGMSRYNTSAVRQTAKQENQAASGTPAPAFASSALTGNVTLGCVGNASAAPILTPPTSWTENAAGDTSYSTPTTGGEYCYRDSGFTGTTITWGSASATAFGALIVELDTSALDDPRPTRLMVPPTALHQSHSW